MADDEQKSLFDEDDELLNQEPVSQEPDSEEESAGEPIHLPVGENKQRQLTADDYPWLDVCTAKETEIGNAINNIVELAPNVDRDWIESARANFSKAFADLRNSIIQPVE